MGRKDKREDPKKIPQYHDGISQFLSAPKTKKIPEEPSKFIGYLLKWDSSALTNSLSQMSGKSRLRNVFHGI